MFLLTAGGSFGSLQGIDLLRLFSDLASEMSREIAGAFSPFLGRIRSYGAKCFGINIEGLGTTLARIDYRVALATVKIASFRSHERAGHAFLYSYAQHWNIPPG